MRERAVRTRREPLDARRCTYGMVRSHSRCVVQFGHAGNNGRPRPKFTNREETIMASTQPSSRKSVLKEVATIGLDLAKTTVHFVGLDARGCVLSRRQYSKGKLLEISAKMGPCRIGMEVCCGAHHLARQLLAQGHDVKLMPPKYGKPFVKRDKNDCKDAEACAEACLRPTMRFAWRSRARSNCRCSRCTAIARGWWATARS